MLLAIAPFLGVLDFLIWKRDMFDPQTGSATQVVMMFFITSIITILIGTITSVREIVKEDAVYKRERMVGLRVLPFVASKAAVGFLFAIYSALMLFVFMMAAVDFSQLSAIQTLAIARADGPGNVRRRHVGAPGLRGGPHRGPRDAPGHRRLGTAIRVLRRSDPNQGHRPDRKDPRMAHVGSLGNGRARYIGQGGERIGNRGRSAECLPSGVAGSPDCGSRQQGLVSSLQNQYGQIFHVNVGLLLADGPRACLSLSSWWCFTCRNARIRCRPIADLPSDIGVV